MTIARSINLKNALEHESLRSYEDELMAGDHV
jgi:hypothetical protein